MSTLLLTALLVILGAAGLTWLFKSPGRPLPQQPLGRQMLRALLDALLYQGAAIDQGPQASLSIRVRDDPRVLVLRKYRDASGAVGVRAELPSAAWAEPYYDSFRRELESSAIAYADGGRVAPGQVAVAVDVGHDLDRLEVVVRLLFERVFGVHLATQCVGYFNEHMLPLAVPHLTGIRRPAS